MFEDDDEQSDLSIPTTVTPISSVGEKSTGGNDGSFVSHLEH
jgi:hypothetical protein